MLGPGQLPDLPPPPLEPALTILTYRFMKTLSIGYLYIIINTNKTKIFTMLLNIFNISLNSKHTSTFPTHLF